MPSDSDLPQKPMSPPTADPHQANKYVDWVVELINKDKLEVIHSDLKKFDLSTMQDHYRISLQSYDVEISHSKHPKSGQDIFVMIFNNLSNISLANNSPRVILAYLNLTREQFEKFKFSSDNQINRKWRQEQERRFKAAMAPVDELLDQISSGIIPQEEKPQAHEHSLNSVPEQPLPEPMKLPPVPDNPPQSSSDELSSPTPQPFESSIPPVTI